MSTTTVTPDELEALHSKLAVQEQQMADLRARLSGQKKPLSAGEWKEAVRRAQVKKHQENLVRAENGANARAQELRIVGKELKSLEARERKDHAERDDRFQQHDRARMKIADEFASRDRATVAEIRVLRDRLDAAQAEGEASPVNVSLPKLPPIAIDHSDMIATMERPMKDRNGKLVNPVARLLRFGGM